MSAYTGMRVALGTMHGKEASIAPALLATAGLHVVVPAELDTDRFGTFTRDVKRLGTMEEAAAAKAHAAMTATGLTLGLASEGSFGPHPAIPLLPAGHELLVFIDKARGLHIIESMLTLDVIFAQVTVQQLDELAGFLASVGFPQQQLVVRPADDPDASAGLSKGIADPAQLASAFAMAGAASGKGEVLIETDMRAFANPSRMRAIGVLARRLGERLARSCPHCGVPGFGGDRPIPGRPCADCGTPTALPLEIERQCGVCGATERHRVEPPSADPVHCPLCNP